MKKILCAVLALFITFMYTGVSAFAIQQVPGARTLQANPNAKTIDVAFVFDGPSDKNAQVLKTFQQTIARSLLPDFKANFPADLVFTGNWTEQGAKNVSDKALASRAKSAISLGYMSSGYLASKPNKISSSNTREHKIGYDLNNLFKALLTLFAE